MNIYFPDAGSKKKSSEESYKYDRLMGKLEDGDNPFDHIMAWVGDPRTAEVSTAFRALTEASYRHTLEVYKKNPLLKRHVALANPRTSEKNQVQQIYHSVMTMTAPDYIRYRLSVFDQNLRLARGERARLDIAPVVQLVEDANLVRFFSVVLNSISQESRPQIDTALNTARQAKLIRDWMEKNQQVLRTITKLELSNITLTTLPEEISLFTGLTLLNLASNRLTYLPESFGNLRALTLLNLVGNGLTYLPESFGNLRALTLLCLFDNRLTHLPESFSNLRALRQLWIFDNQLNQATLEALLRSLPDLNLTKSRLEPQNPITSNCSGRS